MKKKSGKIAVAVTIVAVMILTMVLTFTPTKVEAASIQDATLISFGQNVSGKFSKEEKIYYKFTVPQSGKITFEFHGGSESSASYQYPSLYVLDCNGKKTHNKKELYYDENRKEFYGCLELYMLAGTHYIYLYDYYYKTCNISFKFCLSYESSNETVAESQDNRYDTIYQAPTLDFNKKYYGQLSEDDTQDIYKFTLLNKTKIEITHTNYNENGDRYQLLDSSGKVTESFHARYNKNTGQATDVDTYTLNPGTYYLKTYTSTSSYSENCGFYNFYIDCIGQTFSDVKKDDWFYDSVAFVYARGIMTGQGGTSNFAPAQSLQRQEFANILWRLAGEPSATYEAKFPDVPNGTWFTTPIMWAYKNGVITGYATGNFGVGDNVTREQFATMLYRYAKEIAGIAMTGAVDISSYPDAGKVSPWALEAMQWAVGNGIITGKQGIYLDPAGNAARCEGAAMIQRFMEKFGL